MPGKQPADVERLRPHLARLALLDATPVQLAEGLHLARIEQVRDPGRLVREAGDRPVTSALFLACVELARPLARVDATWLGSVRRDLAVLEQSAYRQELAQTAPLLRRLVAPARADRAWLVSRRERIDALAAQLRAPSSPTPGTELARLGPPMPRPSSDDAPDRPEDPFPLRWQAPALLDAVAARSGGDRLKPLLGVTPARLDKRWRQALGLLFATRQNRSLLLELLRDAAIRPGEPAARAREPNRGWIARAATHFNVDAWLAHREERVELDGRPYVLATEEDPMQILRLGNPFRTCLALETGAGPGENAAAVVPLAVEANQRVVYLRSVTGSIVARQRLAISTDWALLRYRLYVALPGAVRPAVEAAFSAFVDALARDARLPHSDTGSPEPLYRAFRYAEEPLPAEAGASESSALARYAAHLGFPVGDAPGTFADEARAYVAREDADVETGYRIHDHAWHLGPSWMAHGEWLIERLGKAELTRRARRHCRGRSALFRQAARLSAREVIDVMARTRAGQCCWGEGAGWVVRARSVPGAARAWIQLARRCASAATWVRDTVMRCTLDVMPWLLHAESGETRALLEADLGDLWRRFEGRRPGPRPAPAPCVAPGPWPERDAYVEPVARARAVADLVDRVGEPLVLQLGFEAERLGVEAQALLGELLARYAAGARPDGPDATAFGWASRADLANTIDLATDAALAAGPASACALLWQLPDFATAACFAERMAKRFGAGVRELVAPPSPEDASARLRWRWLRLATER